jgi:hypothetical protein
MPHRKLVQIGQDPKPPKLPTLSEYFRDLVQRQGEDIRLLKERAQALADARAERRAATSKKSIREESWRLHPVRATPSGKSAAKSHSATPAKKTKKH